MAASSCEKNSRIESSDKLQSVFHHIGNILATLWRQKGKSGQILTVEVFLYVPRSLLFFEIQQNSYLRAKGILYFTRGHHLMSQTDKQQIKKQSMV